MLPAFRNNIYYKSILTGARPCPPDISLARWKKLRSKAVELGIPLTNIPSKTSVVNRIKCRHGIGERENIDVTALARMDGIPRAVPPPRRLVARLHFVRENMGRMPKLVEEYRAQRRAPAPERGGAKKQ